MSRIQRLLAAVVFASTCLSAAAQDKSDYFGQAPSSAEAAPAPAPKRVSISNRSDEAQGGDEAALQEGAGDAPAARQGQTDNQGRSAPGARSDGGARAAQQEREGQSGSDVQRRSQTRRKPNEFQKFIFDSSGQALPIFGAEFFRQAPSTFAPVDNAPVPADHVLGAGDELLIRGWGSIDIDYRARIDRNGLISIPTVGSVVLAGVKAGDAEGVIRGAVGRLYKGVTLSVNFGNLSAITVYVVGQAVRPGTYTVSSLSTLVTAIFASGGPNGNGAMRRIQVRRDGALAAELDLYAFIGKGDKSADIKLRNGDTIVIPPASGHVALMGKVNTPAVFELRGSDDTVGSLLEYAGGMPVVADPRRAFLERVDPARSRPRSVEQFALDAAGLKRALKDGDVLNVTSITPEFSNAVQLRGNVDQPVRVPFTEGMRVSDLIPNREYLISRKSIKRHNMALSESNKRPEGVPGAPEEPETAWRIGNVIDEINWDYAVIERVNRSDLSSVVIPFNLGKVFSEPGGRDNMALLPGDTVTVFSQDDLAVPIDKRRVMVRVEGEVNTPGVYQMNAGETLQDLLSRAGGPTANAYLFGTGFYREQVRKEQERNLEKAALRLEKDMRAARARQAANQRALGAGDAQAEALERQEQLRAGEETILRFRQLKPTGRIAFGLDPKDQSFARLPHLKLEDGDRLVIPARPAFVNVFGAVNGEASPLWRARGRVGDYLKMVGASADADLENVVLIRVDGSVVGKESGSWLLGSISGVEVMPGDSIVVPEKLDRESGWSKFTRGTREWAQIFANFGLGAAAIKTLR